MERIKRMANGLLVVMEWGGIYSELLLPVATSKTNWKGFAAALFADIRWASRFVKHGCVFTERRTELSGCLDERRAYKYLVGNPHMFRALVEIFNGAENEAHRRNTGFTEPVCSEAQALFGRHGIERNGVDYGKGAKGEEALPQWQDNNDDGPGRPEKTASQERVCDGLNYEVQEHTRPGLGTFASIVGNWADVRYLQARTPHGYTSLITTAKQVKRAIVTALPGEVIALIPNKREDATGMQCLFARERTEGISVTQDEIDLLTYALTAIANCTGDGLSVRQFEGFRDGIHSKRESLIPVAFNGRNNERERIVAGLFDSLMVRSWDYASGIIPFE
jgi:hypothetical protein